jgi:hypothetical protein
MNLNNNNKDKVKNYISILRLVSFVILYFTTSAKVGIEL